MHSGNIWRLGILAYNIISNKHPTNLSRNHKTRVSSESSTTTRQTRKDTTILTTNLQRNQDSYHLPNSDDLSYSNRRFLSCPDARPKLGQSVDRRVFLSYFRLVVLSSVSGHILTRVLGSRREDH